jgi:hypothetical protein
VNYVSFWDAARFANWLTNGQPTGAQSNLTTENGMYALGGMTNPFNPAGDRLLDFNLGQNGVAIASENEWYKAAYYQPFANGGDTDGYWLYPTASNSITNIDANYENSVGNVTIVGTYAANPSYYGTFDQGGNVWEWNDGILSTTDGGGLRGGAFSGIIPGGLQSSDRFFSLGASGGSDIVGFRVSSLTLIPEPSAYAAILGCLGLSLALMRRKGRGRSH